MKATLAGKQITSARVTIPKWGCWYVDATVAGDVSLSGSVELVLSDATGRGTILAGGSDKGRSYFRLVGGAGGWGEKARARGYANDAGVKVSTVLADVAREVGETMGPIPSSLRTGPAWVRPAGRASLVLEEVAPAGWYVDAAGVTQLGARPRTTFASTAQRVSVDLARRAIVLASESIAALVPGVVVDGIEAVDVEHELTPDGLRTTIWGDRNDVVSRRLGALRRLLEQVDPGRRFSGIFEYRVAEQHGALFDLQPVRVSAGMPELSRVRAIPGVAGVEAAVVPGSRCYVAFIEESPARPVVVAFEESDGEGFLPLSMTFARGVLGAARITDSVVAGPFGGNITTGSMKVRIG